MHWPDSLRKTTPPELPFGHGMKTQWPVASTPLPLGQMQAPMSSSPSMQGTLSAGAEGAGGGVEADAAGGSTVVPGVLDARGEAEADAAGAGGGVGDAAGGAAAWPQASTPQAASRARTTNETMR
jgi:hypothetical protein